MKEFFVNLLNMSIAASWLILAVILFRLIFKKAPRWIVGILWCMVGFRLICPVSVSVPFSLIRSDTVVIENNNITVDTGVNNMDTALNTYLMQSYNESDGNVVSNSERIITSSAVTVLLYIWISGVIFLVVGSVVSCARLKLRLRDAVRLSNNIFETEKISSPFVLGIIRPRIYIPYYLETEQLSCVVLHEQAHIRRKDHIIKPVAYMLLSVYWFNPLVWVAFILLCRDIELACDEKVIRTIGFDKKKLYSMTLLECSIPHRLLLSCPIAFAEVSVKERIVNIMKIKKTNKVLVAGALLTAIAVVVVFATNQANASENRMLSTPIVAEQEAYPAVQTQENVVSEGAELAESQEDAVQTDEGQMKTEQVDAGMNSNTASETSGQEEAQSSSIQNDQDSAQINSSENEQDTNGNEQAANGNEQAANENEQTANGNEQTASGNEESTSITAVKLVAPLMGQYFISMQYSSEHLSVDYVVPQGSPIVASITGTVSAAGFDEANGNYIVITNSDGWSVYYNHCESVSVAVNDSVSAGTIIATVGSTGKSTGPHLCFAVTDVQGNFYNPETLY